MRNVSPVSVVIPSYNRLQLTVRAVKSVLAQTWREFEVIVVDDGSDANQTYPGDVIDDNRVRLVCHYFSGHGIGRRPPSRNYCLR